MLTAKIKNGQIVSDNPKYFTFQLAKLEGKNVKIEQIKSIRSLQQNKFYFGVVLMTIAEVTGNDIETLHVLFRNQFVPRKFVQWKGREIEIPKSTTELSVGEFVEYIERIKAEVSTLGITIPEAEDELSDLKQENG